MTNEEPNDPALRPTTFAEIIGQQQIKDSLALFIHAARRRNKPIDHILLRGRPGLGKTTFAHAITTELDYGLIMHTGPSYDPESIFSDITRLSPSDELLSYAQVQPIDDGKDHHVIFVDEVHAVPRESFEILYPLLEDFHHEYIDQVTPFTFIGGTTDAGKLPAPFRDRFGIDVLIDYYPNDEINQIIRRSFAILSRGSATAEAIESLAERSRGTPRRANTLLRRAIDVMEMQDSLDLTAEIVSTMGRMLGIDALGLGEGDRMILSAMRHRFDRATGLAAIAAAIGEDTKTIEQVNEPWLVRGGFIDRTRSGRKLTAKGEYIADIIKDGEVRF